MRPLSIFFINIILKNNVLNLSKLQKSFVNSQLAAPNFVFFFPFFSDFSVYFNHSFYLAASQIYILWIQQKVWTVDCREMIQVFCCWWNSFWWMQLIKILLDRLFTWAACGMLLRDALRRIFMSSQNQKRKWRH